MSPTAQLQLNLALLYFPVYQENPIKNHEDHLDIGVGGHRRIILDGQDFLPIRIHGDNDNDDDDSDTMEIANDHER